MKICIIGAGNAGCIHAFKLTEFGHEVRLVKTSRSIHDEYFDHIQNSGKITAIDDTNQGAETTQSISLITRDIKAGISGAEIVLILTQTLQHEHIARLIAPHLADGQLILIVPGNLGSIILARHINTNVIIGEGESTIFDGRIENDMKVHVHFKNVRNAISFLPSSLADEALSIAKHIIDTYGYKRNNVIETALHNPNLIVHTVGTIMSAPRIEKMKGDFWMYRESFSPAVWNLIHCLDDEKNRTIVRYGGEPLDYLDACKFRNEKDLQKDGIDVFRMYAAIGGSQGPASLNVRFLFEDVPNGLCLLSSLANKAGVDTPVCNAMITVASSLMKTNFWNGARTLERLGLADWSIEEIRGYIDTGIMPRPFHIMQ